MVMTKMIKTTTLKRRKVWAEEAARRLTLINNLKRTALNKSKKTLRFGLIPKPLELLLEPLVSELPVMEIDRYKHSYFISDLLWMETLMAISDLEVDRIIEQVLIRPPSQPYSYSKKTNALSQEHLWHFQLQEENTQLKEKIKSLKVKHRRK